MRAAYAALTASRTSSLLVLRHQHSCGRHTRLPGGHGHHLRSAGRDAVQGVREIDLSRLAAELERHALHRRCGLGQDLAADGGRAGEGDHVHRRIGGEQFGTGRPGLDDHAEHTGRQPGRLGRHTEGERRDRRERARPQDDRVPGHQRRDQLLEGHDDGAVVRGDGHDDARPARGGAG